MKPASRPTWCEVDGQPVDRVSDLRNKVGLSPVGEKIEMTIQRDGRRKTVTAEISESGLGADAGDGVSSHLQGASLRDLREGELDHVQRGVLVENVARSSAAWRAGLRRGDVIVNVNRQDVNNLEQLRAAVPDKDAACSCALTATAACSSPWAASSAESRSSHPSSRGRRRAEWRRYTARIRPKTPPGAAPRRRPTG